MGFKDQGGNGHLQRIQGEGPWGMPNILRLSVFVHFLMLFLLLQCPLPQDPCLKSCYPSRPFACHLLQEALKVPPLLYSCKPWSLSSLTDHSDALG